MTTLGQKTPPLIVWCNHAGCPEGLIPSDPRHLDNLAASWRCPTHSQKR